MKRAPVITLAAIAALAVTQYLLDTGKLGDPGTASSTATQSSADSDAILQRAFDTRQSDLQVRGSGTVSRVLSDDNDGARHQRFILRLGSGQTVLVAHNIDVAPRLPGLRSGDQVEFYGEYEWTQQGGVVHWTHRANRGNHEHGWLRFNGQTYQ